MISRSKRCAERREAADAETSDVVIGNSTDVKGEVVK
jgi:hypothetical protein